MLKYSVDSPSFKFSEQAGNLCFDWLDTAARSMSIAVKPASTHIVVTFDGKGFTTYLNGKAYGKYAAQAAPVMDGAIKDVTFGGRNHSGTLPSGARNGHGQPDFA